MADTERRRRRIAVLLVILLLLPLGVMSAMALRGNDAGRVAAHGGGHGTVSTPATFTSQVRITGTVTTTLSPGVGAPVALRFHNDHNEVVTVHSVHVRIAKLHAPNATKKLPCTKRDFEIRQMPRNELRLPPNRSTDLNRIGLPVNRWPHLVMRNRPVNQDGCKGARITLSFSALRAGSGAVA